MPPVDLDTATSSRRRRQLTRDKYASVSLFWNRHMSQLRNPLLLILLLSLPFFMVCVGNLALSDTDAMYPEIAREMRQTGDWITPRLNGAQHFDKPPLAYWLTGLTQHFLGETDAAARLWPALTGWATVLLIGCLGTSLYGRRAGWLSALVLAACLGPYLYTRVVSTDSILCFFCTLAILSYTRAMVIKGKHDGVWLLLMFISLGLAGLTKGLVGMGLPAGIIFLHAALSGRLISFFHGARQWGLLWRPLFGPHGTFLSPGQIRASFGIFS